MHPRTLAIIFFVITLLLTVIGQVIHHYVSQQLSQGYRGPISNSPAMTWRPYGFYITNAGPSVVAIVMTAWLDGFQGLRRMAVKLMPLSMGPGWKVLAFCLLVPLLQDLGNASAYLYAAVIINGLLGAGICEELGWRGFALPQLQRRYSALGSSLIVGAVWGLWHWPNYLIASNANPLLGLAMAILMGMLLSIIYTWIYNSTHGNLFAVIVFHGSTVAGPSGSSTLATLISMIFLLLSIGLICWYGPQNLSWSPKITSDPTDRLTTPQEMSTTAGPT